MANLKKITETPVNEYQDYQISLHPGMTTTILVEPEDEMLFNNLENCEVEVGCEYDRHQDDGFPPHIVIHQITFDLTLYSDAEIKEIIKEIQHNEESIKETFYKMYDDDRDACQLEIMIDNYLDSL